MVDETRWTVHCPHPCPPEQGTLLDLEGNAPRIVLCPDCQRGLADSVQPNRERERAAWDLLPELVREYLHLWIADTLHGDGCPYLESWQPDECECDKPLTYKRIRALLEADHDR